MQPSTSLVLEVRDAVGALRRHRVEADGYLIGSGDFCDLRLDDASIPLVHSEIHMDNGVIWIAAVDAPSVEVNGKLVPRLTLRSGDTLRFGSVPATVRMGADAVNISSTTEQDWEDLSHLSAVELCERIESEEAAVRDEERQRWQGVESLLVALEQMLRTDRELVSDEARSEEIVQQLHALSEALAVRTQQLAEQEQHFLNTAQEIKHSQDEMTRRMEVLIQQLDTNELRASA